MSTENKISTPERTTGFIWDAPNNRLLAYLLKAEYEAVGMWPADGVDVTDAVAAEFTGQPPQGKIIGLGSDGMPAWVDVPPLTPEQQIAAAEAERQSLIAQVNQHISSKQWPGKAAIGRLKGDELEQYNLWLDYLDALEAIDVTTAPQITWPDQPTV
ncbi:tail fiber assembly protein [Enterobacter hormaechei]